MRYFTRRVMIGTLLLAVLLAMFLALPDKQAAWDYAKSHLDTWRAYVQDHPVESLLIYFVLYVFILTPPIPLAAIMALLGGALFGRWLGTGVMSLASTTAATLAFLGARYLFRDWVQRHFGERLKRVNSGFERDGGLYIVTLRWLPVIPFFLINMGLGLTPVPLRKYVMISWASMLPFTFLYANVGHELQNLQSPSDVLRPEMLAAICLFAFLPLILKSTLQRLRPNRKTAGGELNADQCPTAPAVAVPHAPSAQCPILPETES